jgi:aspartate aminotransferase, cytoplasmic
MGSFVQSSSLFSDLEPIPYDEAYFFNTQFVEDSRPNKVNLGPGVYRDDDGKPWILPSVNNVSLTQTRTRDKSGFVPDVLG